MEKGLSMDEPQVIVIDENSDSDKLKQKISRKGAKEGKKSNKSESKDGKNKESKSKKKLKDDEPKKKKTKSTKNTPVEDDDIVWMDEKADETNPNSTNNVSTGNKSQGPSVVDAMAEFDCSRDEIFSGHDVSPVHRLIPDYRTPTEQDYQEAERLGIKIKRRSPYTKEECNIIKEVFNHFAHIDMQSKGIVIDENSYNEYMIDLLGYFKRQSRRKTNKVTTRIIVNIGKRIKDRTILSLYLKARDLLNPLLLPKELTSDQQQEIVKFMANNPNHTPSDVAKVFNVSPRAVNIIKAGNITKTKVVASKGLWTADEDAKLLQSVMNVINSEKVEDVLRKDIDWVTVSQLMETRSLKQCEARFMQRLQWKIGVVDIISEGRVESRMKDAGKILYFIHMSMYHRRVKPRYDDIDWNKLVEMLPHLQLRTIMSIFDQLLESVPQEVKERTFKKQVKWLFTNKLIQLISVNGDNLANLEAFWISCQD